MHRVVLFALLRAKYPARRIYIYIHIQVFFDLRISNPIIIMSVIHFAGLGSIGHIGSAAGEGPADQSSDTEGQKCVKSSQEPDVSC